MEHKMNTKRGRISQSLYTPIAIVVAGVLIGAGIYGAGMLNGGSSAGAAPAQQFATKVNTDAAKLKIDGDPVIGSASAPVVIAYWFDYQCPFCKMNELETISQIEKDYVQTGKVRIVFKDFAFLGPDSITLASVARAVWESDPQKYYAWHHAMLANQGQEGSGWATEAKIKEITATVLSADETARVIQLAKQNAAKYEAAQKADQAEGTDIGINGTPAMLIGDQMVGGYVQTAQYAQLKAVIDAQLAK